MNEITTTQKFELAAADVDFKEVIESISEEMDGLGTIGFTKVNVPNGGVTEFEVDGEDVKELVGVIVARVNENVYFDAPFGQGDGRPACSSADGITGYDRCGTAIPCKTCAMNQWGENGKPCTNKVNLYLLQSGELMPIQLVLPPSSIKYLRDYVGKKLLSKGLRPANVVTRITLEKVKGNFTYSAANFEMVEKLQGAEKESMRAYADAFAEYVKEQAAAYVPAPAESDGEVLDVAYEDLPFC